MMIRERIRTVSLYDLEGSIEQTIQYLNDIKEKYGDGLVLEVESDYDNDKLLSLEKEREETEKEKANRLKEKEIAEEIKRNAEFKQYQELKKKYGDK